MSARLLRQKPLAQNYPSTEEIIAACTAILSAKCTPEAQPAPQPEPANTVSAIADALPQPGLALQTVLEGRKKEEREKQKPSCSIRLVVPRPVGLSLGTILDCLTAVYNWASQQLKSHQTKKRLRVCETVSLGEKRFVAVVEIDGEQFLVGGAAGSVATLARLEKSPEFSEVLQRRWSQDPVQA